uniref:ITP-like family peptide 1 n=1 Tax=Metopograpsus thukuhar TaxID=156081 RepID=A0A2I6QG63_9EUCA|nr:ITP-like family peptide 1 [Metopograpsus thukuhar]
MASQNRVLPLAGVWLLLLGASLLAQDSLVSAAFPDPLQYKLSPGTQREFEYYQCTGDFHKANREHYRELRDVCVDCHNVYRKDGVLQACMSNCFDNDMFPVCVKESFRTERLNEYYARRLQITR